MANELKDLAARTLKMAAAAGAGAARVRISADRSVEISYRERKPETIKEASTRSLGLEIFADGRYSSQTTSDLREGALKAFVGNAVAATKLLAEDPFRTLPDPKYYEGRSAADLKLVDPAQDKMTPDDRHALVKAAEAAALERGGDKVISVSAGEQDGTSHGVMAASNGFEGEQRETYFVISAEMTVRDEGDRRPNGYAYAVTVSRAALPSPQEIGRQAAENTLAALGAKKLPTETLPIIIENRTAASLLGGFLQAMSGRNLDQKQSFLLGKTGQKVASPVFTLIDDPLIAGGLGSRAFDGDGLAARRRVMVEAGVLREFFIDWYYSRKLKVEPTSGSTSNLVLPPGRRPVATIMKDLGRGILVTGFIGGNSNPTTGDFSIGIFGRLFDGGAPVQAVAEMNIADNHLKFWERLVEAANDPWPYASQRLPSLVVDKVVVSGV